MIEMPPVRRFTHNGVNLAYYEAGSTTDAPPVILCHGWPEIAFTWRAQIATLAAAGLRVIAPDQRGYGLSDCPEPVEAYDIGHLTGDLVALLDHIGVDKAIFVGHDWGGFVVWEMGVLHPHRVAGIVGMTTPHLPRAPADPIAILRKRYGERMYIVQFQNPDREPDRIFAERPDALFDAFLRAPSPPRASHEEAAVAGVGASSKTNLDFLRLVQNYDAAKDHRRRLLSEAERAVFVEAFRRSGFSGGINWYRNITRNWERNEGQDRTIRVPAMMMTAEWDPVQPPSIADGMEALVPDLERHMLERCGHWMQEERADEVSRLIIDWRRRRFG